MISGSVDRRLDAALLTVGEFPFSEQQAARLGLPQHSGPIGIVVEGDGLTAVWNARSRRLGGDDLRDTLQLWATANDTLRFTPSPEGLHVSVLRTTGGGLRIQDLPPAPAPSTVSAPRRRTRHRIDERLRIRGRDEFEWPVAGVGIWRASLERLRASIEERGWDSPDDVALRLGAERLAAVSGFEELLALGLVKIDHLPHQEAAALRALRDLHGRAVLADEVGLGKTIEAGLITKELIVRGLVRRVLIVCPAPLRQQWREELHDKFEEEFRVVEKSRDGFSGDRLIMSLNLAIRNRDALLREPWDLVIVDEAHKVAGAGASASRDFARRATDAVGGARYALFLSATPVQNDLLELYRIVDVLRPGTFTSPSDFKRRYVAGNGRRPRDEEALRRLCGDVMVRTTRAQAGLDKVRRHPVDIAVTLSPVERRMYDHCVHTMRSLMTREGDHLRRLQLAKRLVGSPRALSDTALGMARRTTGDPRLAEALWELGHMAGDMGRTSRQHHLLALATEWITDPGKGKVLVFTGQTSTLEDAIRVLGDEGIEAVPFHGQMSASARNDSIKSFQGPVPVMVSTDAGAEGLNLQFANCVVNYDLPWNPMRIEQRIGRVHRVTQTRDVHVANLYARDTIDERVYAILHDKLAMFELLFGQITTILGEVSEDDTFEQTILKALVSPSDAQMIRRLDAYADDLAAAKERTDQATQMGGLSAFLGDLGHRATIRPEGARELMPVYTPADTSRRENLGDFVRRLLRRAGADIVGDDGDYLVARLAGAAAERMERDELHLAFTPEGRERHADAELCAVGSEVFEEIVETVAHHGDLSASIAVPPTTPDRPWIPHAPGVALAGRKVVGPVSWWAETTWKVTTDGVRGGTELVTIAHGDAVPTPTCVNLTDGEALPPTLPAAANVVEAVTGSAVPRLAELAEQHGAVLADAHRNEIERVVGSLDAQIAEQPPDRAQLERLRDRYRRSTPPAGEVRADLLAIQINTTPPFILRETWRREDGIEAEVELEWDPAAGAPTYRAADGATVARLSICSDGHAHDAEAVGHCTSCGRDRCPTCGPTVTLDTCEVCGTPTCGPCMTPPSRKRRTGVCNGCRSPERRPDLDTEYRRAWELRDGLIVHVGAGAAEFRDPGGHCRTVSREARVDRRRSRIAAEAASRGLPAEAGLRFVPAPERDPADLLLAEDTAISIQWRVEEGTPRIDPRALRLLPEVPTDAAPIRSATGAERELLDRLAQLDPPPAPPCLVAYETLETRRVSLRPTGLATTRHVRSGAGEAIDDETGSADWTVSATTDEWFASCSVAGVSAVAERVHDGYRIAVAGDGLDRIVFVPSPSGRSEAAEQAVHESARAAGLPGSALVTLAADPEPLGHAPASRGARLAHRRSWPFLVPQPGEAGREITPDDLTAFGLGDATESPSIDPVLEDLWLGLRSLDTDRPPVACTVRHRVIEGWEGSHSCALRDFVTAGMTGLDPILADTNETSGDFAVCAEGHLHVPAASDACPVCGRHHCRACEASVSPCATCGRDACTACRDLTSHGGGWTSCVICGEGSCDGCGRDRPVSDCLLCLRPTCSECADDGLCSDCRSLASAASASADSLPPELAATGLSVRELRRGDTRWVLLHGAGRKEIVVRGGEDQIAWLRLDERPETSVVMQMAIGRTEAAGLARPITTLGVRLQRSQPLVGLLLEERPFVLASWGDDRQVTLHEAGTPEDGPGVLSALVDDGGPYPVSADPRIRRHFDALFSEHPPSVKATTIRFTDGRMRTEVTGDGILISTVAGADVESRLAEFSSPHDVTSTPDVASHPTWRCLGEVSAGEARAEVLGVGQLLALSVSWQGETRSFGLGGGPVDLLRVRLARYLGLPNDTPLDVTGVTLAPAVSWPTLAGGGKMTTRHHEPVVLDTTGPCDSRLVPAVLQALGIPIDTPAIPWTDLPDSAPLTDAIRRRFPLPPGRTIGLGLRVSETYVSESGTETRVEYVVPPGEVVARVRTVDDGSLVTSAFIDRSGHVTARPVVCVYCRTETCGACEQHTESCRLCGVAVCGRCTPATKELHLCPACHGMAKARFLTRRIASLEGKPRLAGKDTLHRVQVARTENGWNWASASPKRVSSPERIGDPSVTAFLESRAG